MRIRDRVVVRGQRRAEHRHGSVVELHRFAGPVRCRLIAGGGGAEATEEGGKLTKSGGHLKTGWFGDMDTSGKLTTWDPTTGGAGTQSSSQLASQAAAAAAYAVAKGDARRVQDFGVAAPAGVTILKTS